MPLQATSGAASYDGFGGGAAAVPKYIEEYFSTFLYKGTDATQTITNGIDLSTKGGLVWIKDRTSAANHYLFDTERGATSRIFSNLTNAASTTSSTNYFQSFNNNGFTVGYANSDAASNYASWSIAKAPKFFDVVTWTGDGTSPRAISHNLGSAPGCVIVKQTNAVNDWCVWHTSTGTNKSAALNTTAAFGTFAERIKSVTSTTFSVGNSSTVNDSGATYVAYLFAHDAGGFGLTGTDNVISCGSYTGNGSASGPTVTLGYEPQFVMIKAAVDVRTSPTDYNNWAMVDVMRGMPSPSTGTGYALGANLSTAENGGFLAANSTVVPTATGFQIGANESMYNFNGATYIYIAIRRGPMKVPTDATKVFAPVTTFNASAPYVTTGFPVDMAMRKWKAGSESTRIVDRLRGTTSTTGNILETASTAAEASNSSSIWALDYSTGMAAATSTNTVYECFKRAPSFFDEVCFSVPNAGDTVAHNLASIPELMIVKDRNAGSSWYFYHKDLGATKYLKLQTTDSEFTNIGAWNNTAPTSTVFTVGGFNTFFNYVAYLFATCAGVSKVGSYTGTATTKQIDCGFTAGARFVLIKRTDSTGDWYVWDTARGIVSGNDSYLLLNSTAAEVTSTDYVDTYSAGFEISSTAPAAINASGGTFIFLAIS